MGRIEILTGVERRCDWSDDDKLSILEEAAVAGARVVDVARRHDIHPQQIYTWRRKFAATRANPVVSFLPVALIASEPTSEAERPECGGQAYRCEAVGKANADRDRLQGRSCFEGRG
ncbi:transposase [Rhizobium ruizarguesonis]